MMANEMDMRDFPSMTTLVVAVVQAKLPSLVQKQTKKTTVASHINFCPPGACILDTPDVIQERVINSLTNKKTKQKKT